MPRHPAPITGQVSAAMLNGLCRYVIVGHSERRRDCCESNELVGRKARAALEAGVIPIACVGESLDVRDAGSALTWVEEQVDAVVSAVGTDDIGKIVVAYEPIWAIGTGRSASPGDAEEVSAAIRARIGKQNPIASESSSYSLWRKRQRSECCLLSGRSKHRWFVGWRREPSSQFLSGDRCGCWLSLREAGWSGSVLWLCIRVVCEWCRDSWKLRFTSS